MRRTEVSLLVHTDNVLDEACDYTGRFKHQSAGTSTLNIAAYSRASYPCRIQHQSTLFNTDLVKIDTYDDYKLSSKRALLF